MPGLYIGAAYYPEHWPEARWQDDLRLMLDAGLNVGRMGEFAWSTLEPASGKFDFNWLERAVNMFEKAGIRVVLGTPSAAPPAWLVEEYPDLLAIEESGRPAQFGNRCHYCVTSPAMYEATGQLVQALARRFGPHPNVIGWQIDNEFCRVCYCPRCRRKFQDFLRERYQSLEQLNTHWSTAYWSQTYSSWEQIPIPIGPHNPGLMLEFKHFVTHAYRSFQKFQIDRLRPHLPPAAWITHNYMSWFDGFDHYQLSADLDKVSIDWYIGKGHNDPLKTNTLLDQVRGFKRQRYWLMETQPGNVNWNDRNNMLNRGEARAMAWQAVAHGAEAVLYWQWRSALGGQEQYHGSLIDASGRPRPFYDEVKQIAREFAKVSGLLDGALFRADIALLHDYDSRWSINWQRHNHEFDYVAHIEHYAAPLSRFNLPFDVISPDGPLDGYRLVIAPALLILDEARSRSLEQFVEQGGTLVLTARCGMKDRYNALLPSRQPGPLARAAGVEVEEYYSLETPIPIAGEALSGRASIWAERLKLLDGEAVSVLARYGAANGWLDDQPALTRHAYGKGQVYYVATLLDEACQAALTRQILATAGDQPLETPAGVQLHRGLLSSTGQEIIVAINHTATPHPLSLPWPAHDHLSGAQIENELHLPGYAVAVLTKDGSGEAGRLAHK
jgi:beta-galactosidase